MTGQSNLLNLKELDVWVNRRRLGARSTGAECGGLIRLFGAAALMLAAQVVVPRPVRAQSGLPGDRVVRGLRFVGNHALDDYTLSISIATSNSSWWVRSPLVSWLGVGDKRYFNEREFRRDVLRLKLLYDQSGYVDAQVDTTVRRDSSSVWITFYIHEGEPIRVTQLAITGAHGIVPVRRLLADIPLAVGDPFNRFLLQASADTIRTELQNHGYPFAQVFRSFDMDADRKVATVGFDVDPGIRATVGAVRVSGEHAISEQVIRRMIPVRAGKLFRLDDLYESQHDLYGMDVFNYVSVSLADTVPPANGDSLVTVDVRVTEGPLHRIRAGAGYGTIDCFRGLAGWTAHNFFGGGRTLDLTAHVSKIGTGDPFSWGLQNNVCHALSSEQDSSRLALNYLVTASVSEPFVFSRNLSATLSLSAERRSEFQAYLRQGVTGELDLTRHTRWGIPITLAFTVSDGRTVADPATFCVYLNVCRLDDTTFSRRRVQSTLGLSAVRNRTNSPLDPTRGSAISAEVRWASSVIGSDSLAQFTRMVGQIASYHRIGRRTVLAWRLRAGTIVAPSFGFATQSLRFVPPEQRFYGGGPNSVRGYSQNGLGPVVRVVDPTRGDSATINGTTVFVPDTITSPTGGNKLLFANVELRFPLPGFSGRLSGALFVDAGQVFESDRALSSLSQVRVTPGAGVRIASPLGPIRLDVAYNPYRPQAGPLYERQGSNLVLVQDAFQPLAPTTFFGHLKVHFSVGQAF